MNRPPKLSLLLVLCLFLFAVTSAQAEQSLPTKSRIQADQVSWLERLGNTLFGFVADIFGFETVDEPVDQPETDDDGPLLDDGSGTHRGHVAVEIRRDGGWEENL
jgi:hypothetical protein